MSKFDWADFLIFGLVFVYVTLKLVETSVVNSRPSVLYGANLIIYSFKFKSAVSCGQHPSSCVQTTLVKMRFNEGA